MHDSCCIFERLGATTRDQRLLDHKRRQFWSLLEINIKRDI